MRGVKRAMFVGRALRSNSNSGVSPHGHGCLTPSNPNPNPNPNHSVSVTGFRYLSAYAAATSLVQDALTKAFKPKELASFNNRPVHSATRLQLNNFRSFSIHSNISLMIKSFNLLQRFWTIMIFHSKWLR
ncbi:hypothetical protein JHK87_014063 [Glycine soja]|nr:hypothetical protein JHK87_014063 [Glycine soja]